jgi:hypothetical protein
MHCSPVLLGALADGELWGLRAWRVRRHVATCSVCQQELAALQALNATVRHLAPLSTRRPILRPIGLPRPVAAALAMAGAAGFLVLRLPTPRPELRMPDRPRVSDSLVEHRVARADTPKKWESQERLTVSVPVALAEPRRPRPRTTRRKIRRTHRPSQRALTSAVPPQKSVKPEPEQVIIIATVLPPPEPVTVVLDDKDDEGGTIHIESTIPAAYVIALQKESN